MFDASDKKEERTSDPSPCRLPYTIERVFCDQCLAYGADVAKALQRRSRMTKVDAASRHWTLTNSRPSANVTLIILRVEDLGRPQPYWNHQVKATIRSLDR